MDLRQKNHPIVAIFLMGLVSFLLVPLLTACIVLAVDSPVTHSQKIHLGRAVLPVLLTCLLLQIVAAYLFQARLLRQPIHFFQVLLCLAITVGCIAGSFGIGFFVNPTGGGQWRQFALTLFG